MKLGYMIKGVFFAPLYTVNLADKILKTRFMNMSMCSILFGMMSFTKKPSNITYQVHTTAQDDS